MDEICNQIQIEKSITEDIIDRTAKREQQTYHWNIGRILFEYRVNDDEYTPLLERLHKMDQNISTVLDLKRMFSLYWNHPDLYQMYLNKE